MSEQILDKINNALSKKRIDSFEFNSKLDSTGSFTQFFTYSYEYSENSTYYVSLVSFECSSLFPNIDLSNNKFHYNNGIEDKVISLDTGCYDVKDLNQAVQARDPLGAIGDDNINLTLIESTGKCLITLKNNYKIDFTKEKTFRNLVGFESKIVDHTEYSKDLVSVLKTQKIYIYSDLIVGSNYKGKGSTILYCFPNKYIYGSVIALSPNPRKEKL